MGSRRFEGITLDTITILEVPDLFTESLTFSLSHTGTSEHQNIRTSEKKKMKKKTNRIDVVRVHPSELLDHLLGLVFFDV